MGIGNSAVGIGPLEGCQPHRTVMPIHRHKVPLRRVSVSVDTSRAIDKWTLFNQLEGRRIRLFEMRRVLKALWQFVFVPRHRPKERGCLMILSYDARRAVE